LSLNLINPFMKFASGGGGMPYYEFIGKTTLSGTADSISVDVSSDPRENYMVLARTKTTDVNYNPTQSFQFDGISNSEYARVYSEDSGGASTANSQNYISSSAQSGQSFSVSYISNYDGYEKLLTYNNTYSNSTATTSVPHGTVMGGKWANTSNNIDSTIAIHNETGSVDYAAGSELVVLGYTDATAGDTKWESLADVTLGSDGTDIDTGVVADLKKDYLFFQILAYRHDGNPAVSIKFNDEESSKYTYRKQTNGASPATLSQQNFIYTDTWGGASPTGNQLCQINVFVLNRDDDEKLGFYQMFYNRAGDAATSNQDQQWGWFRYMTNDQIDQINAFRESGDSGEFAAGSSLACYGFDA